LEFLISTNLFIWQDFGQHQEEFAQVDTSGLYRQVSEGNRHKDVMINPKLTEKNDMARGCKGYHEYPPHPLFPVFLWIFPETSALIAVFTHRSTRRLFVGLGFGHSCF